MRFWRKKGVGIPVVRLSGVIGAGGGLRPGLTLNAVAGPLEKAFKMKGPAVALAINSPGGSPVQSSLIGTRIRALATEHDKTVLAFIEDVAASGGYWLACAADEIIADASSVVGLEPRFRHRFALGERVLIGQGCTFGVAHELCPVCTNRSWTHSSPRKKAIWSFCVAF